MKSATMGVNPRGRVGVRGPVRVALVLAGIGRVQRGAEVAFLEIARRLAEFPDVSVELFGSGLQGLPDIPAHAVPCRPRERFERWPRLPAFRTEGYYEEFTYAWNLARGGRYRPSDFDVAVSCTYPWVNWYLRWAGRGGGPRQVYVTQNGDWPCQALRREFRYFRCDGLVCVNLVHYERHKDRYHSVLIPNGVDPEIFRPGVPGDSAFDLPGPPIPDGLRPVLIVSALTRSKDVAGGIRAAARVPNAFLIVAGDGPERSTLAALARELLPGRHCLLGGVPRERMPSLFRRADAFLHLSRDEPFGIVYLEAAATGLPQVVNDGPVPRWILQDSGVFVDTSDVSAVAGGLERALRPEEAAWRGEEARRRVLSEFTWDVQAAKYRDFFLELLAATPRSAPSR